ncbi:zona pellucida sperm-binding protein 1-like [Mixophyes fleayi]|uniref:zona pellucida sperm-binding protein 1-like n=1 Tax=Mixophyes fleayi TaxID=3061075 RepID=UPI003F4DA973
MSTPPIMVSLHLLGGLEFFLGSVWFLLGSCTDSTEPHYQCGEEGVQVRVPPGYLGSEITFQVRDEFEMGYDLEGCLSKCLFTTIGPNGENVFYSPYTVCLSVRKEGVWLLRVRLIGSVKSEDIDLICPKPKSKRPRVIPRTHKPRTTKMTTSTTPFSKTLIQNLNKTTFSSSISSHAMVTLPQKTSTVIVEADDKVTLLSTKGRQTKDLARATTAPLPHAWWQTPGSSQILTSIQSTGPTPTTDHLVTVNCFPDGYFRLIISRYVTSPPLQLTSVLGPGTCPSPTVMGDFLEFQGYLMTCSTQRFFQGHLVYELYLTAKPNILVSPLGSITRDSSHRVLAQCTYNSSLSLSFVSLAGSPPPFPSVSNSGELNVELRISKGSSFSSFYTSLDFPLQILLRELVYLEARLLQPSDPRLHLRLHHCWGAPSLDSASTTRWPLVSDGCPFSGDDPMTKILPGPIPSSYQRFVVSAFTFIAFPNKTQVYIFCSVSVCLPSLSESCTSDCGTLTRRARRSQSSASLQFVSTSGPLIFQQAEDSGLARLQHLMPAFSGIIIAFLFLLVLLFLTGTLKCSSFTVKFRGHLRLR